MKQTLKGNGIAWGSYDFKNDCAVLHYDGGIGSADVNTPGGSGSRTESGGNTGTDAGGGNKNPSSSEAEGAVTFPDFTINNVILFEITKDGVSVFKGNVYSYKGNYYVCIADASAGPGWSDYNDRIPQGNKWPYIQLNANAKVLTESDYSYDNNGNTPYFESKDRIQAGIIYKDLKGNLYILNTDYGTQKLKDVTVNNMYKQKTAFLSWVILKDMLFFYWFLLRKRDY